MQLIHLGRRSDFSASGFSLEMGITFLLNIWINFISSGLVLWIWTLVKPAF